MNLGAQQASSKSNTVAVAAEEMSANMHNVAAAMEQSTTNTNMVATASEEMSSTIGEIVQNAEKARFISDNAAKKASEASDNINALGESATSIGKVIETITEISEQVNLLALNATIEEASGHPRRQLQLQFALSETSADFDMADVLVTGGALSNWTQTGTTYTATYTPTAGLTGAGSISVPNSVLSDVAGNFNADGAEANNAVSYTIDQTPPAISLAASAAQLKAGETATISIVLTEAATDFTLADLAVSGGTLSGFAGSGASYSVLFTPFADSTAAGVVSVASDRFTDAVGNWNKDGADANNTVTLAIDTAAPAPAITINTIAGDDVINLLESGAGNVAITLNTITADSVINAAEAAGTVSITGTVTGGTTGNQVTISVNGQEFTGSIVAGGVFSIPVAGSILVNAYNAGQATVNASAVAGDAAGNNQTVVATPQNYAVDTTPPSPTLAINIVTADNTSISRKEPRPTLPLPVRRAAMPRRAIRSP